MSEVEMSARIGAMIVDSATAAGARAEALERATGFAASVAADPDARISLSVETALWEEAARLTQDRDFGLHTAERLKPGTFDVLDYVVRTAPTAREALERLARYNRIEHDIAVFRIIDRGAVTRVEHDLGTSGHAQSRHSAELTLASHVIMGSQITGTRMAPLAVEFKHARPPSIAEHVRVFGVEPRFAMPCNALEWDRETLDRANPTADPALARTILRHADAILAARPAPAASTADRVRKCLATKLGDGDVSLKRVARDLGTSERTLQRRLASEHVTFDALVDDIRHQLSLGYLSDRTIAISEVAYLLGYSEPSAFHRAFRRWTGATPSEVRQRAADDHSNR